MPLRSTWVLNEGGIIVSQATLAAQIDGSQKTQLVDSNGLSLGMVPTESGNSAPVYQTDRPDSGMATFHLEGLAVGIYPFVLIDISDNVNYNHTGTSYAHLHLREFDILCDTNGAWNLQLGFVKNVTTAGADLYVYRQWMGAKDVGNALQDKFISFPVGAALRTESFTTAVDQTTYFKSDVVVPNSLSPITPSVNPDDGDVVVLLEVTGGNVLEFFASVGYHSH